MIRSRDVDLPSLSLPKGQHWLTCPNCAAPEPHLSSWIKHPFSLSLPLLSLQDRNLVLHSTTSLLSLCYPGTPQWISNCLLATVWMGTLLNGSPKGISFLPPPCGYPTADTTWPARTRTRTYKHTHTNIHTLSHSCEHACTRTHRHTQSLSSTKEQNCLDHRPPVP